MLSYDYMDENKNKFEKSQSLSKEMEEKTEQNLMSQTKITIEDSLLKKELPSKLDENFNLRIKAKDLDFPFHYHSESKVFA